MSQAEHSGDEEISEYIRPSAGGPETDVADLMQHVQTKVRSQFCGSRLSQPGPAVLSADLRGPARRINEQQSLIQGYIYSAEVIGSRLLEDHIPEQPRLTSLLRYTGLQRLGRVGKAVVFLALRQIWPLLQAPWRQQMSVNEVILAQNRELLRRLTETEATLRRQEERMAWLVGEVLTARSRSSPLRVVSEDEELLARVA